MNGPGSVCSTNNENTGGKVEVKDGRGPKSRVSSDASDPIRGTLASPHDGKNERSWMRVRYMSL